MDPASAPSTSPDILLHHLSINAEASSETILLIHGAFSSSLEWDLVTPLLSKHYHLLVPDLPGHGKSISVAPLALSTSAGLLASLIRARALDGKAHLVGFSLGSIIAATLASQYPDVVATVLVSGFIRLPSSWTSRLLPYFFRLESAVTSVLPRAVLRSVMDGADIQPATRSPKLCREVCALIVSDAPLDPVPARMLIIAATKGGLIPSNDRVDDARMLAAAAKKGCPQSRVVEHRGMRHPWDRQDPQLFAETVMAWIEHRELPSGFQEL